MSINLISNAVLNGFPTTKDVLVDPISTMTRLFRDSKSIRGARRGKFTPNYQIHKLWGRMFQRVLELEQSLTDAEAIKRLKFFAIQYLWKVANLNLNDAKKLEVSMHPFQISNDYFRDGAPGNLLLDLLDYNLSIHFEVARSEVLSICNGPGILDVLGRQHHVCLLKLEDDESEVTRKIDAMRSLDSTERSHLIVCELPQVTTRDALLDKKQKWIKLSNIVSNITDEIPVVAIGSFNKHDYVLNGGSLIGWKRFLPRLGKISQEYGYVMNLHQSTRLIAEEYDLTAFLATARLLVQEYQKNAQMLAGGGEVNVPARFISIQPLVVQNDYDLSDFLIATDVKFLKNQPLRLDSHFINSFTDFFESSTLHRFQKFAVATSHPAAKLLATAFLRSIAGFLNKPLDRSFAAYNLSSFLQESYLRVLNTMEVIMSIDYTSDAKCDHRLANFKDLLMEEILLWLEFCEVTDIDTAMEEVLSRCTLPSASIRPTLSVVVNTGARCASFVTKACRLDQGNPKSLNVICYDDNYFQTLNANNSNADEVATITAPDYEASLNDALVSYQKNKTKINLVFADPHGCIVPKNTFTASHDVSKIIDSVVTSGMTDESLTIAIDLTIGKLDEKAANEILETYIDLIESGKLNIVFFRSLQKFDSFGTDKLSGGHVAIYSGNQHFVQSCRKVAELESSDVDSNSKKLLVHLYENCADILDDYRTQQFANIQYVWDKIDKTYVSSQSEDESPHKKLQKPVALYLDELRDLSTPFLKMAAKSADTFKKFFGLLSDRGFYIPVRWSFGYTYTTMSKLSAKDRIIYRVNLGLEDEKKRDLFIQTINDINQDT